VIGLRSGRARASIDPQTGGRLVSLVIDGHEIMGSVSPLTVKEFTGQNPEDQHDWYRGSFPLSPWAGALRDGAFVFDDVTRHVQLDAAGKAQHGVVAERPWQVESALDGSAVTLSVAFGPELPGRWPFAGRAVQSFVLDESGLLMRLEVHSSARPMPAIAGFHPWFRDQLDGGERALIQFSPSRQLIERAGIIVPTDSFDRRPWDAAFIELTEPPTISWPGGPSITLESDAPVWVYYEQLPGAFCIEPWTGPFNSIDTEWAKVVVPGHPLVLSFAIRFP
jgi:aldose 1-epimerase